MLRARLLCVVPLFLFLSIGTCLARDATIEIEGRYWLPQMTGEAKLTGGGVGSVVDFRDDLGLGNRDFPEGRLTWHTGDKSRLRLAYIHMKYSGDTILDRSVDIDGTSYGAGTPVSSDVSLEYLRLGWIWQFFSLGNGSFRLGTIVEVKGFSTRTAIEAPILGVGVTERIKAPLPTVGAVLDVRLHPMVGIFAEISGISVGRYGSVVDGEAGLKFAPLKHLTLVAGYRGFSVNAKDGDDYIRMTVRGPHLGATFRF